MLAPPSIGYVVQWRRPDPAQSWCDWRDHDEDIEYYPTLEKARDFIRYRNDEDVACHRRRVAMGYTGPADTILYRIICRRTQDEVVEEHAARVSDFL